MLPQEQIELIFYKIVYYIQDKKKKWSLYVKTGYQWGTQRIILSEAHMKQPTRNSTCEKVSLVEIRITVKLSMCFYYCHYYS